MGTIADKLAKLIETKKRIKEAIIAKGVTDINDVYATYPDKILSIKPNNTPYRWSEIGFPREPEFIKQGYDYAVEIKNNWNTEGDYHDNDNWMAVKYKDDYKPLFFPNVDTTKVESINQCFLNSSLLAVSPFLKFPNTKDFYLYEVCQNTPMIYVPSVDLGGTDIFKNCEQLTAVGKYSTKADEYVSTFSGCTNLRRIEELDFTNVKDSTRDVFAGCINLRYCFIKNLGAGINKTDIILDFSETKWGFDGDGITGCRQSMVDTLLTYSHPKAEGTYYGVTVYLSKESFDLLSADEVQQIQLKGITIAY